MARQQSIAEWLHSDCPRETGPPGCWISIKATISVLSNQLVCSKHAGSLLARFKSSRHFYRHDLVRRPRKGLSLKRAGEARMPGVEGSWPVCADGAARPRVARVSLFFQPPSRPSREFAEGGEPPPWTGRPQGPQVEAAVSEWLLGRSEQAAVYVAYIDAYPEALELEITATASVAYRELRREGDDSGPDVFGRHWPMVGEERCDPSAAAEDRGGICRRPYRDEHQRARPSLGAPGHVGAAGRRKRAWR